MASRRTNRGGGDAGAPETTPAPEPQPEPVDEKDWPWPTGGGSYRRDPVTGELTRIDEHEEADDGD